MEREETPPPTREVVASAMDAHAHAHTHTPPTSPVTHRQKIGSGLVLVRGVYTKDGVIVRSPGGRPIGRHPWKTAWSTGAWRRPPPAPPSAGA